MPSIPFCEQRPCFVHLEIWTEFLLYIWPRRPVSRIYIYSAFALYVIFSDGEICVGHFWGFFRIPRIRRIKKKAVLKQKPIEACKNDYAVKEAADSNSREH